MKDLKAAKKLLKRSKKHPDWEFLNKLTSEEVETMIQQIVKEDQHGRN